MTVSLLFWILMSVQFLMISGCFGFMMVHGRDDTITWWGLAIVITPALWFVMAQILLGRND